MKSSAEVFDQLRLIGPPTGGNLIDPRGPKKQLDWSQWDTEYIPATGGALEIELFASRTYRYGPLVGTEKDIIDYSLVEEGSLAADEEMAVHGMQMQLLHDLDDIDSAPTLRDFEQIRAFSIFEFRRGGTRLRELIPERISGPGWVGAVNASYAGDDLVNFGNPLNDFWAFKTAIPVRSSQSFRVVFISSREFAPTRALRMRVRTVGRFYKAPR